MQASPSCSPSRASAYTIVDALISPCPAPPLIDDGRHAQSRITCHVIPNLPEALLLLVNSALKTCMHVLKVFTQKQAVKLQMTGRTLALGVHINAIRFTQNDHIICISFPDQTHIRANVQRKKKTDGTLKRVPYYVIISRRLCTFNSLPVRWKQPITVRRNAEANQPLLVSPYVYSSTVLERMTQ
jgi:hypothetical protein